MTSFLNGPATGEILTIRRAPYFLRVVTEDGVKFDALDQLEDTPTAKERIYVYRVKGEVLTIHLSRRPRSGSGWYPVAKYELVEEQPDDAAMRDNLAWQNWCRDHAPTH